MVQVMGLMMDNLPVRVVLVELAVVLVELVVVLEAEAEILETVAVLEAESRPRLDRLKKL